MPESRSGDIAPITIFITASCTGRLRPTFRTDAIQAALPGDMRFLMAALWTDTVPIRPGTRFVSAAPSSTSACSASAALTCSLTAPGDSPSTSASEKSAVHSFLLLPGGCVQSSNLLQVTIEFFDSSQRHIQSVRVTDRHLHPGIGKDILRSPALQTFFDKNTVDLL